MSVRSFHSVYMAGTVAAAALGCYMVSLRVASERAALEGVETRIVDTQRDIRMLQTEIGTRGRLGQLEQWNASALDLTAPAANQFVRDSFQLARLIKPEPKLDVEAPVVLASAPAPMPRSPLDDADPDVAEPAPAADLVHQASLKTGASDDRTSVPPALIDSAPPERAQRLPAGQPAAAKPEAKIASAPTAHPATEAHAAAAVHPATAAKSAKPVKLAEADPLAPLPSAKARPDSKDNHLRK